MSEPVIEVTVAAPVDVVWQALRDPVQLRRWHGWDDPGLDAEIQVIYLNDRVQEDPQRRLFIGTDTFDLTETPEGVRVRLIRAAPGANPDWDAYYDDITEGWISFLHQLKYALEHHSGQDRATHFRAGTQISPGRIEDRLGLTEIASQPIGSPYATTLPMGMSISGTVFFRTERQLGLTVESWGDGLLVVGESVPAPYRPDPASMAILTTYDLSPAELEELRSAWDRWWDGEFRPNEPFPAGDEPRADEEVSSAG
jgi:hypothetical protein